MATDSATSQWGHVIRPALAVSIPLGLAALAGFVLWPGRIPNLPRTLVLGALLVGSLCVTLFVLPTYRAFHGLLAGFEAVLVALLVVGRRVTRPLSWVVVGVGLLAIPLLAVHVTVAQAFARRYTRLPGNMLEALPLTRLMLPPVRPFVDPDSPLRRARERVRAAGPLVARGDSVLLVVLESTRADSWGDPAIAPEFLEWRRHGVYVPRAVSQYPATPLAYGAIFTSQPPSVVAQSAHWSKHRLFDLLAPRFRGVYLSQPADGWFDTGAMTSFITADASVVRRHESTSAGLTSLRSFLEGEGGRDPFFAWVHLFDPHQPYRARGNTSPKAPAPERYRSEVRAVDADLGQFMHWFYEQPFAARTLVVVVGDHGEAMGELIDGEPYTGHHVYVVDAIAHVPLYASGPGLPRGVVDRELAVCQLDVMPTVFDHLGVELPARFAAQGMPLPKLLAEQPVRSLPTEAFSIRGRNFFDFVQRAGRTDIASQRRFFRSMWESGTYPPKLAIERGGFKIVRDATLGHDALYDLRRDPRETRNVAKERPRELRAMQEALAEWTGEQVSVLAELDRLR